MNCVPLKIQFLINLSSLLLTQSAQGFFEFALKFFLIEKFYFALVIQHFHHSMLFLNCFLHILEHYQSFWTFYQILSCVLYLVLGLTQWATIQIPLRLGTFKFVVFILLLTASYQTFWEMGIPYHLLRSSSKVS